MHTNFLSENLKGRGHFEDKYTWKDIIKIGLKEIGCGLDLSSSG
jgi:hypothetical protein